LDLKSVRYNRVFDNNRVRYNVIDSLFSVVFCLVICESVLNSEFSELAKGNIYCK
jgi:hypothetical protein